MANDQESQITESIILGKYYAWRGGSGRPDDYSRTIVDFKRGDQSALNYFVGRIARKIASREDLNQPSFVLVPVPSHNVHDPKQPHRGELLCQAVGAVPDIRVSYGNYVVRRKAIRSSHGQSVGSRPSIAEHLTTLDVQIPSAAGRYVTKLGASQWRQLNAILFDDVRYFGATSEACARKLLDAGFGQVYAMYLGQNQT